MQEYNPNLIGYALGDSLISQSESQLNVAESGAMSRDMPFMARYLVNKMKKDPRIDMKKHWKLIHIFIGHNDMCSDACYLPSALDIVEGHKRALIEALRILKNNLPRTLVNVVVMANLRSLSDDVYEHTTLECYFLPRVECPCFVGLQFLPRRAEMHDAVVRLHEAQIEVASRPEFNKNDFTVVSSPIFTNSYMPRKKDGFQDLSYFAIDCFHVSQKTNAMVANGVWNNLFEPINNRSRVWKPLFERFLCPTPQRPFIVTRENSQLMFGAS